MATSQEQAILPGATLKLRKKILPFYGVPGAEDLPDRTLEVRGRYVFC